MTQEEKVKARSDFKKSLTGMTKEQLEDLAKQITKESEDLDKEVGSKVYDLPAAGYDDAASAIKYFLDKQSVKWEYTRGLITIYEFFDKTNDKISFPMLDTVLRLLGSLQFTGYSEWIKVVTINDYFNPIASDYRELTDKVYDAAERYAEVDKQLQLFETVPSAETAEPAK